MATKSQINYQYWHGFTDRRFGYGSMLTGFLDHKPDEVIFDEKASVSVHMGVPFSNKGWWEGQYKVLYTMWETDTMPASFIRWLPLYDKIIVPCKHNLDLFSKHHDNVCYVPLGVDTTFWKPLNKQDQREFRFHAGGSLWKRKGLDIVVKAFNRLKLPDATLHIKAAPHARDVPKESLGANIVLHREWMSLEQQRDWYNMANVFVAPSRGEGFGLMPLQAIAMGIPTILSYSSGQQQFADLATGVIDCSKSLAETVGYWDEPDLNHLCDLMRNHYDNYQSIQNQAMSMCGKVENWTWQKAATILTNSLPIGKTINTRGFIEAKVNIKIILKRNLECDIGKNHYIFTKGIEYEVPEGVHQVLFDAGYLEV